MSLYNTRILISSVNFTDTAYLWGKNASELLSRFSFLDMDVSLGYLVNLRSQTYLKYGEVEREVLNKLYTWVPYSDTQLIS